MDWNALGVTVAALLGLKVMERLATFFDRRWGGG